MDKEFRKLLAETVEKDLNEHNFYLVDFSNANLIYHRKSNSTIEIIQISKDKNETYITVSVAIVFINEVKERTNINYPFFNEFSNGNYEKISVDDCREKYFLKGNFGNGFHYGDVYLAFGLGIFGVKPNNKRPLGFRIKKFKTTTYSEICNLIIKRLNKAYCWLECKQCGK